MATAGNPSVLEENPNATNETTGADNSISLNAIVIGGTGAVGTSLVGLLLKEKEKFNKITVVGRRKLDGIPDQYGVSMQEEEASGRLVQVEQDMETDDDEAIQRVCTGADVLFCCLGTTRSAAGSAERFHQIDYGIPLKFAKAAKAAGVPHYSLVTSLGSNAGSIFLYLRTKGEIENAIMELGFKYYTILRPGAIDRGERSTTVQKIAGFFFKKISCDTIAGAMIIDAYNRRSLQGDTPSNLIMNNSMMYQYVQKKQSSIGSSVDPPETKEKQQKNDEEVTEVTIEDGGDDGQKEQQEQPTNGEQQPAVEKQEQQPTTDEQNTDQEVGNEQPKESEQDKLTEEQPKEEQPKEEQPKEEQPKEEQPKEEQTTEEQPTEEQPTEEQPTEEQPTKEQSVEGEQVQPTEQNEQTNETQ